MIENDKLYKTNTAETMDFKKRDSSMESSLRSVSISEFIPKE